MMNGIIFMGKVNMFTLPMRFIITLLDLIHHYMGKVQSKTDDNSKCQEIILSLRQTKTGHGMPVTMPLFLKHCTCLGMKQSTLRAEVGQGPKLTMMGRF